MNYIGKAYQDGECVIRQGEVGTCMYVLQQGELEVVIEQNGKEVQLRILKIGDIFGEMALFQRERRSATVRARGKARVLTIDKRTLLRRIKDDPLVAMNLIEILCERIRTLTQLAHHDESMRAGIN